MTLAVEESVFMTLAVEPSALMNFVVEEPVFVKLVKPVVEDKAALMGLAFGYFVSAELVVR